MPRAFCHRGRGGHENPGPTRDPTSVVISIIIIMMAGMASTSAVQDTITGHYMHGLGRIYEGLVNTAGW
ncbi:threonine/serine exporter family protein [Kocuria atrinae]|uniref:threonine/serine exporter family protein n=1 Tax=Kocuria atrinae TaxID=592377 RepID=UPI0021D43EEE|nr:threonine/serine exporter family protein [Kocuria atrinae]